jgi:hypothetical protein
MQYRIWAEMLVGGVYKHYDTPPTSTMFKRSGGDFTTGRKKENVTKPSTPVACAVTPSRSGNGSSPSRTIDGRSKCYRQLTELKNLRDTGVLMDDEFDAERKAILDTLEHLKGSK